MDDTQSAAAESQHRVEFMQLLHALLNALRRHAYLPGKFLLCAGLVRQELMQRRIEETNRRGIPLQAP